MGKLTTDKKQVSKDFTKNFNVVNYVQPAIIKEIIVEKIVPFETIITKTIEIPVEKVIIETKTVEVPIEKIVEIEKIVPIMVDKIIIKEVINKSALVIIAIAGIIFGIVIRSI